MIPGRRYVSMAMGAITVVLLGFVVAVAARSRPGATTDDPLFELDSRLDLDFGRLLAWVVVAMAVIGAVLFALGVQQAKPRQDQRKRSYLGLIIGVIVFFLIFRYVQPLAENMLDPEAVSGTEEGLDSGPTGSSGGSAWLFSLLLAAIVAAALTRVGLAVRDGDPSFEPEALAVETHGDSVAPSVQPISAIPLGADPKARVIAAYFDFEDFAGSRGVPRSPNETARRHARRASGELGFNPRAVSDLTRLYSLARFASADPTESDAVAAESLTASIKNGWTE